ncbi:MAG: ferritin-like domain-containing protein [Proteobacteria bacterium]|nr:ferritin-like domain-containing protein [Pseudomonadota bacterium]
MESVVDSRNEGGSVFACAALCLRLADPAAKLAATAGAARAFARGRLRIDADAPPPAIGVPGRPARPRLVSPRALPPRGLGSVDGRKALLHAVAHIEFNAINLAWDAVHRFRGMPRAYYADWIGVAADEARHFSLLCARLAELGGAYGDFDAHDGLWEMAVKTSDSCLARMALVPRVLEARGLDVTPRMMARLREVGDFASARVLDIILREEVAHVAAGSRWFAWCCEREGRDADATFLALVAEYARGALKGPFNVDARRAAGFSAAELARLEAAA